MDAVKAVLTRRSIRKYSQKEDISKEDIELFLKAGMNAPSAGDQKPWHFIVLDDKNLMERIADFHNHASMLKYADKAILVCSKVDDLEKKIFRRHWPSDCAAATENILIVANAKNIGACWIGIYPDEYNIKNMGELLNLDKGVIPYSLISLGVPLERKKPRDFFDKKRIHYNRW
ncbi:MAG: nitroreductase family protein [Candidatus Thermoplasmatota archaeon]